MAGGSALLCAQAMAAAEVVHRVNAGGPSLSGTPAWSADTAAAPSPVVNALAIGNTTFSTTARIDLSHPSLPAGTPEALFQTERWDVWEGQPMKWDFPVTPGQYEVRLYFAEIYPGTQRVGARVFDVSIEGALVLDNFDVFAAVGVNKGLMKSFHVTSSAQLDIDFNHVSENPAIKGIEIVRLTPTTSSEPFHRTAVSYNDATFDPPLEAARERLWITHGMHHGLIPQFEQHNPSIMSLLYKNSIYTDAENSETGGDPANPGAVGHGNADGNHPEWFLLDSSGERITYRRYSGYHLMDIGNPSYQNAWAKNAIAQAKRGGWTGIFADDLSLALYSTSAKPVKYPSADDWQGAVRSFLQAVGPKLKAEGLLLFANTNSGITWPAVRSEFLDYVDGSMEEGWMRPTVSPWAPLASGLEWSEQLDELIDAERKGKFFLAELPADETDTQAINYGLATMLLGASGARRSTSRATRATPFHCGTRSTTRPGDSGRQPVPISSFPMASTAEISPPARCW